jgi:hypothetical protein
MNCGLEAVDVRTRVTFVEPLNRYIMTYTAFLPLDQELRWRNPTASLSLEATGTRNLRGYWQGLSQTRRRQRCRSLALPNDLARFERHECIGMVGDDSRGIVARGARGGDMS